MKTPASPHARGARAFTLIELLVAAAVSMLLVVTLLTAAQGITTNYSRAQGAITRMGDSSMAIDQIVQDLEGMVVPNFAGGEGLRIEPDGDNPHAVWLTMLSTATDRDNSFSSNSTNAPDFTGAKRAVSYRIANQNPIDPAKSENKAYALYRSIASARHTFQNVTSGMTNLQSQYWSSLPGNPSPAPPAPTHEDAFFAENVVGLQVRFEYLDASGNPVWTAPGDRIRVGRDGTTVNDQPIDGSFRRAEVRITTLSPEGAKRVSDGVFPLDEAIQRFGKESVRETSRF